MLLLILTSLVSNLFKWRQPTGGEKDPVKMVRSDNKTGSSLLATQYREQSRENCQAHGIAQSQARTARDETTAVLFRVPNFWSDLSMLGLFYWTQPEEWNPNLN